MLSPCAQHERMDKMPILSRQLRSAIKLAPEPAWQLAAKVGIHPSTLSRWMVGAVNPVRGDARVAALGELVGVREAECFDGPSEVAAA